MTSMVTEKQMIQANDLPPELLQEIAAMARDDLDTLKSGSLVNSDWQHAFQPEVLSKVRIREPGDELDDNEILLWFLTEPEVSRQRVLSMVRAVYFGEVYGFYPTHPGRSTAIDTGYLSVLEGMTNLTSLNFSSSTFAWDRLGVPEIGAFVRVLDLPSLKKITFFCFPGCYLPLSFFLFCSNSPACLQIEDISPDPVNKARNSNPVYGELMTSLQALHPHKTPSLSLNDLRLSGLGLASNFLEFMEHHRLGWSNPTLLTRLALDLTDTYSPLDVNKPNKATVAGKIFSMFGASLQHLRLRIECDLLNTSPLQVSNLVDSFGTGLPLLRNLETAELTLMVNTTIGTDAHAFARYAWSRLSLALEALLQNNAICNLLIGCEFSLTKIDLGQSWTFQDRNRCMQAINKQLWQNLVRIRSKYRFVQRWTFNLTFYCDDPFDPRPCSPAEGTRLCRMTTGNLPWKDDVSLITTSVYWDNRLL